MRALDRLGLIAALFVALTACTGHEVRPYQAGNIAKTAPGSVVVLMSDPSRPFSKLGMVSVKKYKAGWSDPTVVDAQEELQKAGADLGADAVIVRNTRSGENRVVYVDAEAIKYTGP